jgi:hypothetical protein
MSTFANDVEEWKVSCEEQTKTHPPSQNFFLGIFLSQAVVYNGEEGL